MFDMALKNLHTPTTLAPKTYARPEPKPWNQEQKPENLNVNHTVTLKPNTLNSQPQTRWADKLQ